PNVPFGSQGHTVYSFFANLFEDFVANNILSSRNKSSGLCMIYDDMGEHFGKFNPLFEAFVKTQARTYASKKRTSLLVRHFGQHESSRETVRKFLERTQLMEKGKQERVRYLADPDNWKTLSTIFAEEFSELLDLEDIQASWFPLFGGNDLGRLNDGDFQARVSYKAYKKGAGGEFEPPPFIEDNLALLGVYRQMAKKMNIITNASFFETKRAIAHVQRRGFDFGKDPLERLVFGLNQRGKLEPQIGRYPVKVTSRFQQTKGSFNEVRIGIVDASDSTRKSINGKEGKVMNPWAEEDKQWTDASIYHHELKGVFGLFQLFKLKGVLKRKNVRAGLFSSSASIGKDFADSERELLKPTFLGTRLKETTIDELFEGRDSLVYVMSDGQIGSWESVRDYFIEKAKDHDVIYFQYGPPTQTTKDLKKAGLERMVVVENQGEDSPEILIDLTKKQVFGEK
ncbi:hypothetical protein ACFL0X_01600, partial [Nanoarchaeota archaeon]